jgi:uncharacterized delta-60 repeat protein
MPTGRHYVAVVAALAVLVGSVGLISVLTDDGRTAAPAVRPPGGLLDGAFGDGGVRTLAIGPGNSIAYRAAMQPDGKLVITGTSYDGTTFNILLARLQRDGQLDPTFGTGGIVTSKVGSKNSAGRALTVDRQGRLVVAGEMQVGDRIGFAIARYTAIGELDPQFGTGGLVSAPISGAGNSIAYGVALTPDGHILVAGEAESKEKVQTAPHNDFALARYDEQGRLDETFGDRGVVTTALGTGNDSARDIALDGKGRIVLAGLSVSGRDNAFAVARYDSRGRLDGKFGDDGTVVTRMGTGASDAFAVVVQPDSRIIAAGFTTNEENKDFALVRYEASGDLDESFGRGGMAISPVGAGDDVIFDVGLDQSGRIVVGGLVANGERNEFGLMRYAPDGIVDPTFGVDGKATTALGDGDVIRGLVFDRDGGILAVGRAGAGKQVLVGVARYSG